jgi:hypothetical protein
MVRVHVLLLTVVLAMTVSAAPSEDVVSASTLTRTHTVAPTWPKAAAEVEGWESSTPPRWRRFDNGSTSRSSATARRSLSVRRSG